MKPIESDSIQKSSPLLLPSKRPSVRSMVLERTIYTHTVFSSLSVSFSLSNESSLEKEKDERKKGMRSVLRRVLGLVVSNKKDRHKKGQEREKRDKFRVSN